MFKILIYVFFVFLSSKFYNFYVFLELFLDEPAMILWSCAWCRYELPEASRRHVNHKGMFQD